ncbi:MAG: PEP-CTERM sorting domain-containing protein [Planctomycetes bacterium]|nr:PEP-CTERM sorting domain-containing protein [Planctomycetota bacterium]
MASLVLGVATSASATPLPTFSYTSNNFQGAGADPAIPFGVSTSVAGSDVTVDSSVVVSTPYPSPIPGDPNPFLVVGGLEFVSFSISSDDSGYINASAPAHSQWIISGWADPTAVATRIVWLSFTADGVGVPLDGTVLGLPVFPHPTTGIDAFPIDITGDPAETGTFFDTLSLTGQTLLVTLQLAGLTLGEAAAVDSMQVGLEVAHIPEPATMALMGFGLCSTLLIRRRKR